MGEIATKLADVSIFTAEDPRSEDISKILNQMVSGVKKNGAKEVKEIADVLSQGKVYLRVPERGEAISFAIQKLAKKGDIVVICGKGHEKSMAYGTVEYPWSDQAAVKVALKGGIKMIKHA